MKKPKHAAVYIIIVQKKKSSTYGTFILLFTYTSQWDVSL
jgi:hypothetical protein